MGDIQREKNQLPSGQPDKPINNEKTEPRAKREMQFYQKINSNNNALWFVCTFN